MRNAAFSLSMKRSPSLEGARALVASHLEPLAVGAVLWLLFLMAVMQPLHLTQELHALLPASSQHHAAIHCEKDSAIGCEKPNDDLSQPLSGQQHERHHEAACATDGHLAFGHVEPISAAPQGWDVSTLDFRMPSLAPCLEVPASPKKSRAPPPREPAPHSLSFSPQSGRAPPLGA